MSAGSPGALQPGRSQASSTIATTLTAAPGRPGSGRDGRPARATGRRGRWRSRSRASSAGIERAPRGAAGGFGLRGAGNMSPRCDDHTPSAPMTAAAWMTSLPSRRLHAGPGGRPAGPSMSSTVAPSCEPDRGSPRDGGGEKRLQVGAVDDAVGKAVAIAERVGGDRGEQAAAGAVADVDRLRLDRARPPSPCRGRGAARMRPALGAIWMPAPIRSAFRRARRRRRGTRRRPAPAPRSARRCRRRR